MSQFDILRALCQTINVLFWQINKSMKVKYEESVKYKVQARLKQLATTVVLRKDLADLGDYRQISRALKALQQEGVLARIGSGVYAKAYHTGFTPVPMIDGGFSAACREALNRLGVSWEPGTAEKAYNERQSTQIPVRPIVRLKSRFRRKIAYGQLALQAEQGRYAK